MNEFIKGSDEMIVPNDEGESSDYIEIKKGDFRTIIIKKNGFVAVWDPDEGLYGLASKNKGSFTLGEDMSVEEVGEILELENSEVIQQIAEYLGGV